MANFLLVIDPLNARRESVIARAAAEIAFLPHLVRDRAAGDSFGLVWAAAPGAPISQSRTGDGGFCQVFGEPLGDAGGPLDAATLAANYRADFCRASQADGFHAVICHAPHEGWRVEADVLGLFPIYYWQAGAVLLVGSSPALFRLHPLFRSRLDVHGIAALLLTSGLVGGRTLELGVRRLAPDHMLMFDVGQKVHEVAPPAAAAVTPPGAFDDCVDEIAMLHTRFLRRGLAHSRNPGLLLSGGLDSRLLAGLATRSGLRPHCLTFGDTHDLDARCAMRVAAQLHLPQTLLNISPPAYPRYAEHSVRWEQLSGGLYAIPMGWNLSATLAPPAADRIVCGLTLDAAIGGPKEISSTDRELSFDQLRVSALGYSREELDALVCDRALRAACGDTRAAVLHHYLHAADEDYLRTWKANLAFRQRFAVGACAWRYSFYAWPVLPALDRRLLALAGSLPHETVAGRRTQKAMLARFFPALAALDLDRNYFDTAPLAPAARSRLPQWRRQLIKLGRRVETWLGRDPRFYVRVMEFNSPGWRSVRAWSDRERGGLGGLFDLRALARVLPGSRSTAHRQSDPIAHSTPLKNTVGLMHWLHQHA